MSLYGLFAVMVFLEMITFVWVGSSIGWGWAILIVLTTAVVGAAVVRRAGVAVWRRVRARIDQGQVPGRELGDGFAMLVAGVLLITPGFIADVSGLLLLLPPVREAVYRFSVRRFGNRYTVITSSRRAIGHERFIGEIIDIEPEDDL